MSKNVARVIAEVPEELREDMDRLGKIVDMKMGPIVREALERFRPILKERAAEREKATAIPATIEG